MKPTAPVISGISVRGSLAVAGALGRYWLTIMPEVRRCLRVWNARADAIPDSSLRELAVTTLTDEKLNAEAAAVFATLVPRAHRRSATRLMVAFQVMYDYLDTLGEQPVDDPLRNGLQLHHALAHGLSGAPVSIDYYAFHPDNDDGGYLDALVQTCRELFAELPSTDVVRPIVARAVRRCGEGQAYTHAVRNGDTRDLAAWAVRQDRADGYLWWELAAGAISSVGVYALLASAAIPGTDAAEAERVDAAYYPPMCALSALLDSLVDREFDASTSSNSYISRYPDDATAAARLAHIARDADQQVRRLRQGRRHAAILAGIGAYYLSAAEARSDAARPAGTAILDSLGPEVAPILLTMRLRRHARRRARAEGIGATR